jgi:hypothetical protein
MEVNLISFKVNDAQNLKFHKFAHPFQYFLRLIVKKKIVEFLISLAWSQQLLVSNSNAKIHF